MADANPLPFFGAAPKVWDTVTLAGKALPGRAEVEGDIGRKLDVKSPKGADGATITDSGYNPMRPRITLTFWTQDEWNAFRDIVPILAPRKKVTNRKAVSVAHPALEVLGVTRVVVENISAPRKGSEKGTLEVVISCIEFAPPTKRRGSVTHAVTNADDELGTRANGFAADAPTPPPDPSDAGADQP